WPLKESVPHRGFPKALRRFRINSRWRKSVCQGRRAFVLTRFQKTQKFFPNSGMDAVIERTVYFLQPRFLFTDFFLQAELIHRNSKVFKFPELFSPLHPLFGQQMSKHQLTDLKKVG